MPPLPKLGSSEPAAACGSMSRAVALVGPTARLDRGNKINANSAIALLKCARFIDVLLVSVDLGRLLVYNDGQSGPGRRLAGLPAGSGPEGHGIRRPATKSFGSSERILR